MNKRWPYRTPGIPDDLFARGNVPMTKEEVREPNGVSKLAITSAESISPRMNGGIDCSMKCGKILSNFPGKGNPGCWA